MNWQEYPFLRLVIPLIAGVWAYDRFPAASCWEALPAGLILLFLPLACWHRLPLRFRGNPLFGALILLLVMWLGAYAAARADVRRDPLYIGKQEQGIEWICGQVREIQGSAASTRVVVELAAVASRRQWRPAHGRLLVYLPDTGMVIRRDDSLLVAGHPQLFGPPRNPGAFDFGRYMELRGVTHRVFARAGSFRLIPYKGTETWRRQVDALRDWCLTVLGHHLRDSSTFSVGAAITFGYRGTLDAGLRDAYAASGAMHVLSVSGLHVGLVYLGLSFLLGGRFAGKGTWTRVPVAGLQLAGVWLFVLLAGLPPSGVRAAAMCCFFIAGKAWNREAHVLNTLAASAFCILFTRPSLLFDIGFQLSYAAVAGIVILEPGLYRFWQAPNRVMDYMWRMLTVSVAAQLATFPLGLFYFQQFPVYFWLSGFLAVPASGLILGAGIVLLPLDAVPLAGEWLGCLLHWLVGLLNNWILWIGDLPGSRISGLWIDSCALLGLYAWLIAAALACSTRQTAYVLLTMILSLMLIWGRTGREWRIGGQRWLVIYFTPRHTLIDLIDGTRAFALADEGLPPGASLLAARGFRQSIGIRSEVRIPLSGAFQCDTWRFRAGLVQFYDYRLLVIDPHTGLPEGPRLRVDGLLIRSDPEADPSDLLRRVATRLVIMDASGSPYLSARWRHACARLGLPFYDVRAQGALLLRLQ